MALASRMTGALVPEHRHIHWYVSNGVYDVGACGAVREPGSTAKAPAELQKHKGLGHGLAHFGS